jgi:hypothetical protein
MLLILSLVILVIIIVASVSYYAKLPYIKGYVKSQVIGKGKVGYEVSYDGKPLAGIIVKTDDAGNFISIGVIGKDGKKISPHFFGNTSELYARGTMKGLTYYDGDSGIRGIQIITSEGDPAGMVSKKETIGVGGGNPVNVTATGGVVKKVYFVIYQGVVSEVGVK